MPTRAVLFDFDGTLVDTWDLYMEAYRLALEPHLPRLPDPDEVRALRPTGELDFLRRVVGDRHFESARTLFSDAYARLHDELLGGVYPGVPQLLGTLRRGSLRVGVVTGKSRPSWEVTAARVELGPFDVVVTESDTPAPKPDPGGLHLALETLEVAPREALYIGDSLGDAEAAAAAGIPFLGVLWPKSDDEAESFRLGVEERGGRSSARTPGEVLDHLDEVAFEDEALEDEKTRR